jgi:hypothetical protein
MNSSVYSRFLVNENNTSIIVDTYTNLAWQNDSKTRGEENKMHWANAIDYCNNLSLDGLNNWRLPNYFELDSLLDRSLNPPKRISDLHSVTYWTSTTHSDFDTNAFIINFDNGQVTTDSKTYLHQYSGKEWNVICVHSID